MASQLKPFSPKMSDRPRNLEFLAERKHHKHTLQKLKEREFSYKHVVQEFSEFRLRSHKLSRLFFSQQEEDRKTISRELHDEVAQILTGITFELAVLRKEASNSESSLRKRIDETNELVKNSIQSIHRFARELRPMILDDLGLSATLRSYIKEFTIQSKIPVTLTLPKRPIDLLEPLKTMLFRVTQEAFANIAKHSHARSATLVIRLTKNTITMTIADNGKSFHISELKKKKGRLGLLGMEERVKLASGTLQIISSAGKGTSIIVSAPMDLPSDRDTQK